MRYANEIERLDDAADDRLLWQYLGGNTRYSEAKSKAYERMMARRRYRRPMPDDAA